ncbi:zinc-dependent metalloprotease [Halocatena salina]|uniref:Zinc-dependent metalloprotease n=1 Tax=Halocatena salina TaxID=2934340 RepID=A0A8U0A3B8_9EURY|nr:zinc-dependent metalloprotease [Halocatena salina]UPM43695.1 zinc-dependent metalloprotease [Halocatena salina]
MNFYRAVRAVADASGTEPIDWSAVTESAKAGTKPGNLDLTAEEIEGYQSDVRIARDRIRSIGGVTFDLPSTVEIQHRHHWIDTNATTFERVLDGVDSELNHLPGVVRAINTGSMAVSMGFLANNVLGQYDPLLLSSGDEHALYFVHPNIERIARELSVDRDRFRRWIAFHEVAHAAEFGGAPWLTDHLEGLIEEVIETLSSGQFSRLDLDRIDTTMTAVEGYAELLMDRAFDAEYDDLRRKLDARRHGGGLVTQLMRRLLGLGRKRRQYERGKEFFETVADKRDLDTAALVWEQADNLPTETELDDPTLWLERMPT